MATSSEAYVDTSAFIAFMDASDSHHPLFARLFAGPPRLCTTPLVIAEGHGWFLRRFDRSRGLGFLSIPRQFAYVFREIRGLGGANPLGHGDRL